MRDFLRWIARISGFAIPLRTFYHRLFFSRRKETARCSGIARVFFTPTPTIVEYVRTLTDEGAVLQPFLEALKDDDVVWDVGAGFGLYTLFASARLRGGSVQAFEPEPRIRTLLSKNIGVNDARNVTLLPVALGDKDGEAGLFASDSPNVGTSALVHRQDYPVSTVPAAVTVRRGDTLVSRGQVPAPNALKVDVEGAEARVLAGLVETFRSGAVHTLCCEVHPRLLPLYGSSAEQVESFLASLAFSTRVRHQRGTEYHLLCVRTP